jgi:hypothetical protein
VDRLRLVTHTSHSWVRYCIYNLKLAYLILNQCKTCNSVVNSIPYMIVPPQKITAPLFPESVGASATVEHIPSRFLLAALCSQSSLLSLSLSPLLFSHLIDSPDRLSTKTTSSPSLSPFPSPPPPRLSF